MKQILDNLRQRLRSLAPKRTQDEEALIERETARGVQQTGNTAKRSELDMPARTPSTLGQLPPQQPVRPPAATRTRKAMLSKPRLNPLSVNASSIWGASPPPPPTDPFSFDTPTPTPTFGGGSFLQPQTPSESSSRSSRSGSIFSAEVPAQQGPLFGTAPATAEPPTSSQAQPAERTSFFDPQPSPFGGPPEGGGGDRMF